MSRYIYLHGLLFGLLERQNPPILLKAKKLHNYDNVYVNKIRAAAHCFKTKCFNILCAAHLDFDTTNVITNILENSRCVDSLHRLSRATIMFSGSTDAIHHAFIAKSVTDKIEPKETFQNEEGILYADLDLADCIEEKQ